jgi:truncated hemoglobin YjbI
MPSLNFNALDIEQIIIPFYQRVTTDFFIGFFFKDLDFNRHIPKICLFWEHVLNHQLTPKLEQRFILTHQPFNLKRAQVDRWVKLFFEQIEQSHLSQHQNKQWKEMILEMSLKLK